MSDVARHRQQLREELRARRRALTRSEVERASAAVASLLDSVPLLATARIVAGYRAVRGEIDLDPALADLATRGVTVTVPRVAGRDLEFVPWRPEDPTAPGAFDIPEPQGGDPIPLADHDVVLAPLVAFDEAGHRLGQGSGYYDRAMAGAKGPRPMLIGVAHRFQRVEHLPVEPWDVPLDAVVTDGETIEFRPGALGRD